MISSNPSGPMFLHILKTRATDIVNGAQHKWGLLSLIYLSLIYSRHRRAAKRQSGKDTYIIQWSAADAAFRVDTHNERPTPNEHGFHRDLPPHYAGTRTIRIADDLPVVVHSLIFITMALANNDGWIGRQPSTNRQRQLFLGYTARSYGSL